MDNPEKIRNFIKSAVTNWEIQYLLILGDADQVPVRQVYIADGQEEDRLVATDIYYADLQYSACDEYTRRIHLAFE